MTSPTVRQHKRSEAVARLLVDEITARNLGEGEALDTEIAMMAEISTGRASLREAFRILEIVGVLEVRTGPTGGPIVRDPSVADFGSLWSLYLRVKGVTYRQLMEANCIAEPPLAGIGAREASPELVRALSKVVDDEARVPTSDGYGFIRANAAFHSAIADLAGNPAVYLQLRGNHWVTSTFFGEIVDVLEVREQVLEVHRTVSDAVEAGDAEKAESTLRHHLRMSLAYCDQKFGPMIDQVVRWQ